MGAKLTGAERSVLAGGYPLPETLATAVESILSARLAAPFRCQTHMCGACGGCKAAHVTDLLAAAEQRLADLRASIAALRENFTDRATEADRRDDPNAYARRVVWDRAAEIVGALLDGGPA